MGIQINGQTDIISATDGSLTVSGADLPTVTNLNATGIVTATSFSGPLTGNVTGNLTGTASTATAAATAYGLSGNPNISVSTIGVNGASPQTPIDAISNSSGNGITVRGRSADGLGNIRFTSNNYATLYGGFKHDASALTIFNELSGSLKLGTNGIDRVTIDSSGRMTMPYQPFAFVTQSGNLSFSNGDKLPYNSVVDSRGLTWNTTNNNFVVPATGVYTFSMVYRLEINNADYMYFKIVVNNFDIYGNGNLLYLQKPNTGNSFQTCNATISVKLTQNDTVHVILSHNGTNPANSLAVQSFMSIVFNG
jgi:hypothetical protein